MTSSSEILLEYPEPGFARLLLNRPDKGNAMSIEMMQLFCSAMVQLQERSDVRVLIIAGTGRLFCPGMDLLEVAEEKNADIMAELMRKIFLAISQAPYITIASIHGAAIAGGAGLALASDFIIAAKGTNIGFPEVQRGLVPAQVAVLLRRRLKASHLHELLLLGSPINSERALSIGLIDSIADHDDLRIQTSELARRAAGGAPQAVVMTKRLLAELAERPLEKDLELAISIFRQARSSGEAKEGITAFMERRKPSWIDKT